MAALGKHLAPPSELERTLAFQSEFGFSVEAARDSLLNDAEEWLEKTKQGVYDSTACFRQVMRDAQVNVKENSAEEIMAAVAKALRIATTEEMYRYELAKRRVIEGGFR